MDSYRIGIEDGLHLATRFLDHPHLDQGVARDLHDRIETHAARLRNARLAPTLTCPSCGAATPLLVQGVCPRCIRGAP